MRTLAASAVASDDYPPGFKGYSAVLPEGMKPYPLILREAGYYTSNNSKEDYQFRSPVTMWDESSPKAHYRNRTDKNQPFFSIFNFVTTHESQVWARAKEPLKVDPAKVKIPPYYPDDSISRYVMARFITNVMTMDDQVGEVIRQLKEDGLYDNTIIFFYSDHGDGLPYVKRELYDRGLRVPLLIKQEPEMKSWSVLWILHLRFFLWREYLFRRVYKVKPFWVPKNQHQENTSMPHGIEWIVNMIG
jgi:arylsulfatase A-like enzyme